MRIFSLNPFFVREGIQSYINSSILTGTSKDSLNPFFVREGIQSSIIALILVGTVGGLNPFFVREGIQRAQYLRR